MELGRYYAVVQTNTAVPDLYRSFEEAEEDWYLHLVSWHGWVEVCEIKKE